MTNSCSISHGLPFWQKAGYQEPVSSVVIRTAIVGMGIIALSVGILTLLGTLSWGAPIGWSLLASRAAISLVGLALKCVKGPSEDPTIPFLGTPPASPNELSASSLFESPSPVESARGSDAWLKKDSSYAIRAIPFTFKSFQYLLELDPEEMPHMPSCYDFSTRTTVPRLKLYQQLLLFPLKITQQQVLAEVFASLLDEHFNDKFDKYAFRSLLKYFDPELISLIGTFLKNETLQKHVAFFKSEPEIIYPRSRLCRQFLIEMVNRGPENLEFITFGIANDDGDCFYHAIAQQLGKTVKELRCAVQRYAEDNPEEVKSLFGSERRVKKNEENYQELLSEVAFTAQEAEDLSRIPRWGEPKIEGKILAKIFGFQLLSYEAPFNEKAKVAEDLFPEWARKIFGEGGPAHRFGEKGPMICIGNMDSHFFPIYVREN